MSRPLTQIPRPVNRLRAAPMPKCAAMLIASDTHTAAPCDITRNGTIGMNAPTAVAVPVTRPSFSGASSAGMDVQLFAHLGLERAHRILHHRPRQSRARASRGSPFAS